MTTVSLFGINVPVPFDGPVGGLNNTAKLSLSADAKQLLVAFKGELPLGSARLDETAFNCDVLNDVVRLHSSNAAGNGTEMEFNLPLGLGRLHLSPVQLLVTDDGQIAFKDTKSLLRNFLKRIEITKHIDTMYWNENRFWSDYCLGPDMTNHQLFFKPLPNGPGREIVVNDAFVPDSGDETLREQFFAIDQVVASSASVQVMGSIIDGILFLHADILTTAPATTAQAGKPDEFQNDMLFQYGLVNGCLNIDIGGDVGSRLDFSWTVRRETPDRLPGMLVYRLTDENGYPILVEAAHGFPLTRRRGTQVENNDASSSAFWELTNPAIVVGTVASVTVRSLDPAPVGKRFPDRERQWLSKKDIVEPSGYAPREIHGLAKGAFLRRIGHQSGPITSATLFSEAITDSDNVHIFTRSEIRFPINSETWEFVTQLEERDVVSDLTGERTPVGQRVSRAMGGEVRLPLIDTSFALANLSDPQGRVKQGGILSAAVPWLQSLDLQFTHGLFEHPNTDWEKHVTGFVMAPPEKKGSYAAVLDMPPGCAGQICATARTGSAMKAQRLLYVHGGERSEQAIKELEGVLAAAGGKFLDPFGRFETFWNSLDLRGPAAQARAALRRYLGLERRLKLAASELEPLLEAVKEAVSGARLLAALEAVAMEELRGIITPQTNVPDLVRLLADPANDRLRALLDLVWSGTGPSVYRRAVEVIKGGVPIDDKELASHWAELVKVVSPYTAPSFPDQLLPGFPTPSFLGTDEAVEVIADVWAKLPDLEGLRKRFGAALTTDVYRMLLESSRHSELVTVWRAYFLSARFPLDVVKVEPGPPPKLNIVPWFAPLAATIASRWNNAGVLSALKAKYGPWQDEFFRGTLAAADRLLLFEAVAADLTDFYSKLRFDPPEYIFFTSRLKMSVSDEVRKLVERLWSQKFRLASLGGTNFWAFLLDSESSVVVKLSGTRSIDAIVDELQRSYGTPTQPNPLGLPKGGLQDFLGRLDPAIRSPQWRGVLVLRPTADIGRDPQLAALTGISDFPMTYAAIGGERPDIQGDNLDVYANIFRVGEPIPVEGAPPEDLTVTLIKFDASIRNTRLVAGEVLFRLDIRNLFGRDTSTDQGSFPALILRGTLPRDKGAGANSFEFSAWFEHPVRYDIDLAFIKAFVFRSLRVSTSRGQTSVDIDADVILKKWDVQLGGQDFHVGPDVSDALLSLENLRILLPRGGKSIPFGLPRLLNFELPAISFNWPRPRPLNLWDGIELSPIGMGFLRRVAGAMDSLPFQQFVKRYQWLGEAPPDGVFQLPYLRCSIHFGKLPSLGGTHLSSLKLELVIATVIATAGDMCPGIRIGIGDLDGRDISIDLFGVIKLEIETLMLGCFQTLVDIQRPETEEAVTLYVKNPRLTICGWSPLAKNDQLRFLLSQAKNRSNGRAALGLYNHKPEGKGFFRLYWLLIAHNFQLQNDLINRYLLSEEDPGQGAHNLLDHFIDEEGRKIQAQILEDDSWLVGASFALGEIVERGTLVMHDQHYYGIALRGKAIEALFDVKRLELAYMPGPTRAQDRFRACFRLAALDFIGKLHSGDIAIEWGFNWDFLLDFGFPWKSGAAYLWERSFSLPMGTYEAKFGIYCEKRTQMAPSGSTELTLSAGVGFYYGYYFGFGTPGKYVWARAGIGVFALLEGSIRFELPPGGGAGSLIKGTVREVMVRGVIGIFAYGEGGIEIWVISARFRVSVQAAIAGELHYLPGASSSLRYAATLHADYSASCRVGSGWFSFTFAVSGSIEMQVSGQALLN